MLYKKAKFFWKTHNCSKEIFCMPYDENMEYYAFLKQYYNEGYRQIIITSEIMIEIIKHFVLEKGISVYNIEFMEDDSDLVEEIESLIDRFLEDKVFFVRLLEKLNFLAEKSSIDIKRVFFKGRNNEGIAINFYMQSNGIIGIDEKNFSSLSAEISNLIAGCLFK